MYRYLVLALVMFSSAAFSENKLLNPLEEKFIKETDFDLIYRHEKVPSDIIKWVYLVARSKEMANYGEAYNAHDVIMRGLPMVQHQFTVVSEDVGASLVKIGGFFQRQKLIIVDRTSKDTACTLTVSTEVEFVEGLKYLIEHKREMEMGYFSHQPKICKMLKETVNKQRNMDSGANAPPPVR